MKYAGIAFSLLLAAAPALGQTPDPLRSDIARCAAIEGELDRLQCYDDLAQAEDLAAPREVTPDLGDTGKWLVRQEQNPLDDSHTVFISLTADSGANRWGEKVVLLLRCQSDRTEVFVAWQDYLGNDGRYDNEYKNVVVRVGDARAEQERWSLSTDSKATFSRDSISLIRKMAEADSLVLQTTPYNESPVTAIFDLSGLSEAVRPLTETCHWSLTP